MPLLSSKIPPRSLLRLLLPSSSSLPFSSGAAAAEPRTQKLNRIADELLSLTDSEREDYSTLFRLRLGLNIPSSSGLPASAAAAEGVAAGAGEEEVKEKTAFDIKLDKFDAASKIKVIKEVRTFTDLGLKEAKEMVEKTPVILKKGVPKEEAEAIAAKLKEVGATVVLE
ncbi:uncharacterized protein [Typha angustifolia]|uniref:uncharacterized protein n=1 Tax=Typha angustifolia TaxID=59011 RepID=UPI003C309B39